MRLREISALLLANARPHVFVEAASADAEKQWFIDIVVKHVAGFIPMLLGMKPNSRFPGNKSIPARTVMLYECFQGGKKLQTLDQRGALWMHRMIRECRVGFLELRVIDGIENAQGITDGYFDQVNKVLWLPSLASHWGFEAADSRVLVHEIQHACDWYQTQFADSPKAVYEIEVRELKSRLAEIRVAVSRDFQLTFMGTVHNRNALKRLAYILESPDALRAHVEALHKDIGILRLQPVVNAMRSLRAKPVYTRTREEIAAFKTWNRGFQDLHADLLAQYKPVLPKV